MRLLTGGEKTAPIRKIPTKEKTAVCCHFKPAKKAPTANIGISTRAVPRSGCFRIKISGTPTINPALIRSRRSSSSERTSAKKRANTMIITNLTNSDTREVDPALGAEAGVAHRQHGDEGRDAEQVENRGLIQNQMVVEPGEREHQEEADGEPAHLLPVHAR